MSGIINEGHEISRYWGAAYYHVSEDCRNDVYGLVVKFVLSVCLSVVGKVKLACRVNNSRPQGVLFSPVLHSH